MRCRIHKSPANILIISVIISIFATACGQGPPARQTPAFDARSGELRFPTELPGYMGIVLDPNGIPISNASIGQVEYSTREGMVSGPLNTTASGWIEISKPGYADSYGKPHGTIRDVQLFEARLTPFTHGAYLTGEQTYALELPLGNSALFLDASLSGFDADPVFLELASIDRLDVGPAYASGEDINGLDLVHGFAIQATDTDLEPVELAEGASLGFILQGGRALTSDTTLAWFDANRGFWTTEGIVCEQEESGVWICTTNQLHPLFGIFDTHRAAVQIGSNRLLGSAAAWMTTIFNPYSWRSPDQQVDSNYKQALDDFNRWKSEHGGIDGSDPDARSILDKLINSAKESAEDGLTEAGKNHLITAAVAAREGDLHAVANDLIADAAGIANKLAENDLQESDCGEFKRLLKRAEQLQLFGGDQNLEQQLKKKASEMYEDCDVWQGYIRVTAWPAATHHDGLDMNSPGGSFWSEYHDVNIWTNVETYVMHGEDSTQINFPAVRYSKDGECDNWIEMSAGWGNPTFEFNGRYDGFDFQVGPYELLGGSISLHKKQHFELKEDDDCETVTDQNLTFPDYSSVMYHGFDDSSAPFTLQEMLAGGTTRGQGDNTIIFGDAVIAVPEPGSEKYPFTNAHVTWSFRHVQPKLPTEAE